MLPRLEEVAGELRLALAAERARLVETHPDAASAEHMQKLKTLQKKRVAEAAALAAARREAEAAEREPRWDARQAPFLPVALCPSCCRRRFKRRALGFVGWPLRTRAPLRPSLYLPPGSCAAEESVAPLGGLNTESATTAEASLDSDEGSRSNPVSETPLKAKEPRLLLPQPYGAQAPFWPSPLPPHLRRFQRPPAAAEEKIKK